MKTAHGHTVGAAAAALLASSATLICCVLPAALVALGMGAALASLVSAVPQLVWLSERKATVFVVAAAALLAAGVMLWRARRLACPADPAAARACRQLRRISVGLYSLALCAFLVGLSFAFVLPRLLQ